MLLEKFTELWKEAHGTASFKEVELQDDQHLAEELADCADGALLVAISSSNEVALVLERARSISWWFRGEPCEPDNMSWCSRCKPHNFPSTVYMTTGWSSAFHRSPNCEFLQSGQSQVSKRGGSPAAVQAVTIQEALGSGRFACLGCFKS